jgi:hypothetical protein
MGMPIEDQAREVVENNSELNIQKGKVAAWKAICTYIKKDLDKLEEPYVPELALDDPRLADISMTSYNSIRNSWVAMYEHWSMPDIFVTVQGVHGSVYTQVSKHVHRESDHTARLF